MFKKGASLDGDDHTVSDHAVNIHESSLSLRCVQYHITVALGNQGSKQSLETNIKDEFPISVFHVRLMLT